MDDYFDATCGAENEEELDWMTKTLLRPSLSPSSARTVSLTEPTIRAHLGSDKKEEKAVVFCVPAVRAEIRQPNIS